jgi:1,2-beta-oligoglucan phosphorylase
MEISNQSGLTFSFLENGSVESIDAGQLRINLRKATLHSRSGTGFYLRNHLESGQYAALIGPESNSRFKVENNRFFAKGQWNGLDYFLVLQLSEKGLSWKWSLRIENFSESAQELDLIAVQDAGLKVRQPGPVNEYYVSQYIERLIWKDKRYGQVICARQNMKEAGDHPWLMMACAGGAEAASVDGMQFFGPAFRESCIPEALLAEKLGGEYAGESSVLALQGKKFRLKPGEVYQTAFVSIFIHNHPKATSEADLEKLNKLAGIFKENVFETGNTGWQKPLKSLFNAPEFLIVEDLTEKEITDFFGRERRHIEVDNGRLLSFFKDAQHHVVLRAKETLTDRPHGHIIQAKAGLVPDESIVSTNPFAYGVFNSHLTQGNTNFNILLSICSNQFNQASEAGQRIFVKLEGKYYLLGVPSAFEMGLNHCRWIYKSGKHIFQVRTWTSKESPQVNLDFSVISGGKVGLLVSSHFDENIGWKTFPGEKNEFIIKPGQDSLLAGKFPDARFRLLIQEQDTGVRYGHDELLRSDGKRLNENLFVIETDETDHFSVSILGEVVASAEAVHYEIAGHQFLSDTTAALRAWQELSQNLQIESGQKDIEAIKEILPWFGMNALTHYLTPYGLEQFGGAAWGTRDVSQGPVDFLINLGKYQEARKVLCLIFSNQNPDGGWPQWWMFDSYFNIRAHEAHGDISYWCIIALSQYIITTGDYGILDEVLPYYHEQGTGFAEKTPLREHMQRLVSMITGSFIPGTALVPFGGGDWNDSLQPVSEELASRMISSWTVQMNYQAFMQYAGVLQEHDDPEEAAELFNVCERIRADFNKHLVKDEMVAGYGLVEADGSISVLLHPSDQKTGISYSILPMERGILSGIFTKEQALFHHQIIEKHLKGPDGARLMDRPLKYRGGIQTIFQRAESSTFFGREIGLMYIHEHVRYAESLACLGKAKEFVAALRQAVPVDYREVVPQGDIRQANCYYSSSDIAFKSRYEADERYHEIRSGNITFRGGWRVYSSGPGIFIGLVFSKLLGLRREAGKVIIDPVMPLQFNGLTAELHFLGKKIRFLYKLSSNTFSPRKISVNGQRIEFTLEENSYRKGGAVIPEKTFLSMLDQETNLVEIEL